MGCLGDFGIAHKISTIRLQEMEFQQIDGTAYNLMSRLGASRQAESFEFQETIQQRPTPAFASNNRGDGFGRFVESKAWSEFPDLRQDNLS